MVASTDDAAAASGPVSWIATASPTPSSSEDDDGAATAAAQALTLSTIDCLCLGAGRFLRAVLVPALNEASVGGGGGVALVQPRGSSVVAHLAAQGDGLYPVDTVLASGAVRTDRVACAAAFSLGSPDGRRALLEAALPRLGSVSVLGVGVTEAGLASADAPVMRDLFELLQNIRTRFESQELGEPKTPRGRICVINTDNMPDNGDVLRSHMTVLADRLDPTMRDFLRNRLAFHNTMVDRITSHRPEDPLVPRAEPTPAKALVILDEHGDLPEALHGLAELGVHVRTSRAQLQADLALKLRVANGTHTAVAHLLALLREPLTTCLSDTGSELSRLCLAYLDALYAAQIRPAAGAARPDVDGWSVTSTDCDAAYAAWRRRLTHPHFGMSTFFITQNGAAKGGIRLAPTVRDLLRHDLPVTVAAALAFAVVLRWLTPQRGRGADGNGVFTGSLLETGLASGSSQTIDQGTVVYADQMRYNFAEGWYEFKSPCVVMDGATERSLSDWLGSLEHPSRPETCIQPVRAYLIASEGGNLADVAQKPAFDTFAKAVATLYSQMFTGDGLVRLLQEMNDSKGSYGEGMATDCQCFQETEWPSA